MTKVVDPDYPGQERLSDQEIKNIAIQQAAPAVAESAKTLDPRWKQLLKIMHSQQKQ